MAEAKTSARLEMAAQLRALGFPMEAAKIEVGQALSPQEAARIREMEKQRKRKERRKARKAQKTQNRAANAQHKPRGKRVKSFYDSEEWLRLRYKVLKLRGAACECCGAKSGNGVQIHVDHIKPRSKFPSLALEIGNLQVLCGPCNMGKGAHDQTDWRTRD